MLVFFTIDICSRIYPCCDYSKNIKPDADWIIGEFPDNSNAYEEHGIPLWKYVNGKIIHRTDVEIQADIDTIPVSESNEMIKQINSMKTQIERLTEQLKALGG